MRFEKFLFILILICSISLAYLIFVIPHEHPSVLGFLIGAIIGLSLEGSHSHAVRDWLDKKGEK